MAGHERRVELCHMPTLQQPTPSPQAATSEGVRRLLHDARVGNDELGKQASVRSRHAWAKTSPQVRWGTVVQGVAGGGPNSAAEVAGRFPAGSDFNPRAPGRRRPKFPQAKP